MWIRKGANEDQTYHPLVSAVSCLRLRRCKLPGFKWLPAGEVKTRPKDTDSRTGIKAQTLYVVKSVWLVDSVLCCVKWLFGRVYITVGGRGVGDRADYRGF